MLYIGLEAEGILHISTCFKYLIVDISIAIKAVNRMATAADFDRRMLYLATQLANESDMKSLLLSVLEELLKHLQLRGCADGQMELIALIRCIIRLDLKIMASQADVDLFVGLLLMSRSNGSIR